MCLLTRMSKLDTNIQPADTPNAASTRTTPALLRLPVTFDSSMLRLLLLLRGPLPAGAAGKQFAVLQSAHCWCRFAPRGSRGSVSQKTHLNCRAAGWRAPHQTPVRAPCCLYLSQLWLPLRWGGPVHSTLSQTDNSTAAELQPNAFRRWTARKYPQLMIRTMRLMDKLLGIDVAKLSGLLGQRAAIRVLQADSTSNSTQLFWIIQDDPGRRGSDRPGFLEVSHPMQEEAMGGCKEYD